MPERPPTPTPPPTWWELLRRIFTRIDREKTISDELIVALNDLRDLVGEWLEQIEENDRGR